MTTTRPTNSTLEQSQIREGMRLSVLDGIFAVPYVNLTSGPILVGFLLALGATTAHIGLVSMLPLASGLIQPIGAQFIRRRGGWRRPVVVTAAILDDLLWGATLIAIATLPPGTALLAVVAVLVVQQMITAVVAVSWTSWMSDLVPSTLRGRYFGRRNFTCNAVGALAAVLAGQFIESAGGQQLWSFGAVFLVAMTFRLLSAFFLSRQPEPSPERLQPGRLRDRLKAPFASPFFRRYAEFGMTWGFAVHLSSPFFAVYLIRDLRIDFGIVMAMSAAATLANLLGQRFWGPLSDKYGHYQVMRATTLVVAFQPFWWLFVSNQGLGFALLFLIHITGGFTWGGYQLASGNLMMSLAPDVGKSSFFGAQAAISGLAGAVGPVAGGLLADGLLRSAILPGAAAASSLPALFLISFLLRGASWGLLHRISDPSLRPRMRMTYIINDVLRTSNITQGFSPLLHRIVRTGDADRNEFAESVEQGEA